jgi:hypothetical protein
LTTALSALPIIPPDLHKKPQRPVNSEVKEFELNPRELGKKYDKIA